MKTILNPFGRVDERAMHEQFEDLCGGAHKAERLMGIHQRGFFKSNEAFFRAAKSEGFTQEQCKAFLSL